MAWSTKIAVSKDSHPLRGYAVQEQQRAVEREIRKAVLSYSRCMPDIPQAAARIGLHAVTVYDWQRKWHQNRLAAAGRGRPVKDLCDASIVRVNQEIDRLGPGIGVRVLQGQFPQYARREVAYRLQVYRRRWIHQKSLELETVLWQEPGTVWALDHTEPPLPVDGLYPYILAVRDMASGDHLMDLPVEHADGASTVGALKALFKEHGAPLVLKSDNGSALVCEDVSRLLRQKKVKKLLSPPGYPCYNGSIEAGIGALKTRTHHEAARNDRPGEWTCDDVEAARLHANHTARPKGVTGPTPQQMWEGRKKITARQRKSFWECVEQHRRKMKKKDMDISGECDTRRTARNERAVIEQALKDQGYYVTGRRRIIPPLFTRICSKIS